MDESLHPQFSMGCNYSSMPQIYMEDKEYISNHIPLIYMYVISYPYANPDAGLANLCLVRETHEDLCNTWSLNVRWYCCDAKCNVKLVLY